jgi:hypothetical protein
MSNIEMKEKILFLIEQHSGDDVWLARVYEILSGEDVSINEEWVELTQEQETRLEESRKQHRDGKVLSQQEILERLSKW